jgi:hypothetical protein
VNQVTKINRLWACGSAVVSKLLSIVVYSARNRAGEVRNRLTGQSVHPPRLEGLAALPSGEEFLKIENLGKNPGQPLREVAFTPGE